MSMVLAALMALSMFTGCGGSTTDSSVKKSDSGNDVPTVEDRKSVV